MLSDMKFSKVLRVAPVGFWGGSTFKILIKTSNATEFIESNIQNTKPPRKMILSSNMCKKTYLPGFLEGALEVIQVSSL